MTDEIALKIACGFGAGIARKEEICGAITGGILVLGLRYGRGSNDDRSAMELTYLKTRELMDLFSNKHGTFICRELLNGCELVSIQKYRFSPERAAKNGVKYFMVKYFEHYSAIGRKNYSK